MKEAGNWPWRLPERSLSVLVLYCAGESSIDDVDLEGLYGGGALVVDIGYSKLGLVKLMKFDIVTAIPSSCH